MSYIHGYDPDTLREVTDSRECAERLEEIGSQRSLHALLERVCPKYFALREEMRRSVFLGDLINML